MRTIERGISLITFILLMFALASPAQQAGQPPTLLTFADGNWQGDACTTGGLDSGEPGDAACHIVSGDGDMGYPKSLELRVELAADISDKPSLLVEICVRSNSMQTSQGALYWDGVHISQINAAGTGEELKTISCDLPPGTLNLSRGSHTLRLIADDTPNKWDFVQLDALRIGPHTEPPLAGGHLIPFEVLPLPNANWRGDGGTWGGLDQDANLASDRAAAIIKAGSSEYPANLEIKTCLSTDFSQTPVVATIGLRRNQRMVHQAQIYWDGKLLAECNPYMDAQALDGRDSVLEEQTVQCGQGEYDFSPGEHTIRFAAPSSESPSAMLQVDSFLLEAPSAPVASTRLYLDEWHFIAPAVTEGIEKEALDHFQAAVRSLGAASFTISCSSPDSQGSAVHIGTAADVAAQALREVKPFQERESYVIQLDPGSRSGCVGGLQPLGTVYALSDLELRLRTREGRVYLDFPEGHGTETAIRIVERPSIEVRGEYMNIGYNHKGITPHEWDQERWHTYIDQLVLARLNRFYFYIWNDVYTLYPGSIRSKEPLNQSIHENVRDMIQYAHKRGLEVTYMMCPTYFPRDVWDKHPEMHAEIEYVDHGFPAVCPQSPGAWDLMKEIARSEMEWFAGADSLQIWFYDPGGCWCTKNGCRQNQAENLAHQVKEFSDLFRTLNPEAKIEYNIWPIWLWEDMLRIKYRLGLSERISGLLGAEHVKATAVGASDNDVTLPLLEQKLGFQSTAFIFGANPESGYDFLIPHLIYLKETAKRVRDSGVNGAFGHRLEAWTRYAATFFMGRYLWNPDETKEEAVRHYAEWQTAQPEAGILLSEAIHLLDEFTYEGAKPLLGSRMLRLTEEAFASIPEAHKPSVEYLPAMMEALAVLGRSVGVEDNASLAALAAEFGHALNRSPTLQPLASDQNYLFEKYRTFLLKGWKNGAF